MWQVRRGDFKIIAFFKSLFKYKREVEPCPTGFVRSRGVLLLKGSDGQQTSAKQGTTAASDEKRQDKEKLNQTKRRARKIPNIPISSGIPTKKSLRKTALRPTLALLCLLLCTAAGFFVYKSGLTLRVQADGIVFGLMDCGTDTEAQAAYVIRELTEQYGCEPDWQVELQTEQAFSLGAERKTLEELRRFLAERYLAQNTCAYILYVDGAPLAASASEEMLREQVQRAADRAKDLLPLAGGETLRILSDWEIAYGFCPLSWLREEESVYAMLVPQFETEAKLPALNAAQASEEGRAALPTRYHTAGEAATVVRQTGGSLRVGIAKTVKRAEAIPYTTVNTPTDEFYKDAVIPVTEGKAGVRYTVTEVINDLSSGEAVAWNRQRSEVLCEPKIAYSLQGTSEEETTAALGRFLFPLRTEEYVYTSKFGGRDLWGQENYHRGIDLVADEGEGIYAADGGIVSYAGFLESYGNFVIINHGNGFETVYAHLSSYSVAFEDPVYPGQQIGVIGDTGNTSGTHLHFEIRSFGALVDPALYLDLPPYVDYGA